MYKSRYRDCTCRRRADRRAQQQELPCKPGGSASAPDAPQANPAASPLERLWEAVAPHWQREAAHLPGLNFVDFGLPDLYQALASAQHSRIGECIPLLFKDQEQVQYPSVFHGYLHGTSIVVNHVEVAFPPLLEWCRRLRELVPHAYMQLYLTPPGSQTVRPHSDDRDVLLLQCLGSKQWQVMEPPILFPYTNEQLGKKRPLAADELPATVLSCTVNAGDVLYMPRGFVHMGQSTSDGPSLHLTVAIATHDWSYSKLLADAAFAASATRLVSRERGEEADADEEDGEPEPRLLAAGGAVAGSKPATPGPEAEEDAGKKVGEAIAIIKDLPLDRCTSASDVATQVREALDKHDIGFKRAVPFKIFFGGDSGPEEDEAAATEDRVSAPPAGNEALAPCVVEGLTLEALGRMYRRRLAKHNEWHDQVLAHWSGEAYERAAACASSSASPPPGERGAEPPWRLPPRLDHAVTLSKAGRFRFTCSISDERNTMKVTFVNDKGQYLELYTVAAYLEVMKFVESCSGGFSVADLPAPDPVGQICFAAVALHNGIFIDL